MAVGKDSAFEECRGWAVQAFVVGLIFGGMFLACAYMASKGYRGVATSRAEGYGADISDHVVTDPDRRRKANSLVAVYGTLAATLCLPPIGYAAFIALDAARHIPLPALALLAVNSIAVTVVAGYPLEEIKDV
ncbi:hypothetical protein LTT66_31790 [Nocardia gipuzkoensis]|uniref:hypothetical protein n=1 Tax=Nocardia gipuzkoensis TaxID=2749991 RepID=UPI001E5FA7EA|nr:hypothetical protein [Nocardia gipuzkoensis]UGT67731.1 hypothetical protein LTT66_31790 [Nocardia gipuzkoensis]